MKEKRICPECQKEYSELPALSRKDGKTEICSDCGTMEGLDVARTMIAPDMDDDRWMEYKKKVISLMKGG